MILLFFILGFLVALFSAWKMAKQELYQERIIFDAIIFTAFLSAVGARFFYILFHLDVFGSHILKWIVFGLYPGFSEAGAFAGAAIAAWILSDKKKVIPFPELIDVVTAAYRNGLFIFLAGIFFAGYEQGKMGQPVTLYKIVALVVIYSVLVFLSKKKIVFAVGTKSAVFWFFTILLFFLIDFFKQFDEYYSILSVDQWMYALFLLVLSIILVFQLHHHNVLTIKK